MMNKPFNFFFFSLLILTFLSACKKDDDNDDKKAPETTYYTVTYSFDIEEGNYEDLSIQYMDKDQQMQSLSAPALPWSLEIQKFTKGKTVKMIAAFTAKPGDTLSYKGEAKYQGTDGSFNFKQCQQQMTGLSAEIPVNCTNEILTGE